MTVSTAERSAVLPHNQKAAAIWGAGGRNYDRISHSISDAIEHAVARLAPRSGERVLDVATGTGWAARLAAARGATVTGLDLHADLIDAAKALASDARLQIRFEVGDAEALPYTDASFDATISTFGVMFCARPEAAAAELARVTRKGGRLALVTWAPEGTLFGMFKVMKPYMASPAASPPPSPFEWGRVARVRELLGSTFELRFETGATTLREASGEAVWQLFLESYGPTKTIYRALDAARRAELQHDFSAYHDSFRSELGVAMPREYLLTIGVRK
ncbi:MAG TPA: class I SAM-dependent methyltransferase [Burkholderiales bacterium]